MPEGALTNAAVEWVRRFHETVNALDEFRADGPLPVTDDFTFEDRRSGGVNFGEIDGSGAPSYMASMWEVGGRRPQMSLPEVVAVSGDRLAAVVEVIDYGDDNSTEAIVCYRLDRTRRRLQRAVLHDVADIDAAMSELDRMHAELND